MSVQVLKPSRLVLCTCTNAGVARVFLYSNRYQCYLGFHVHWTAVAGACVGNKHPVMCCAVGLAVCDDNNATSVAYSVKIPGLMLPEYGRLSM